MATSCKYTHSHQVSRVFVLLCVVVPTCLNCVSAFSSLFLSGCRIRDRRRYAFFISAPGAS